MKSLQRKEKGLWRLVTYFHSSSWRRDGCSSICFLFFFFSFVQSGLSTHRRVSAALDHHKKDFSDFRGNIHNQVHTETVHTTSKHATVNKHLKMGRAVLLYWRSLMKHIACQSDISSTSNYTSLLHPTPVVLHIDNIKQWNGENL